MNYLIGSIKHCNRDRVDLWVNSALENCSCQVVLLVLDAEIPESLLGLRALGVEVFHTPTEKSDDVNICKWERHLKVREYLKTVDESNTVLLTDTLDVIFQKDPFEWFDNNANKDLILTSEGIHHKYEPWNMRSIIQDHAEFAEEIQEIEVINSGLIIGKTKAVSDILLHIYTATKGLNPESADQPALNVALLSSFIKEQIQIVNSDDLLAVHCAVAGPTSQFTAWGFDQNYKYGLPSVNNELVVAPNNEPYCIVHQYNRVEEWNSFIKKKYTREFTEDGLRKYHIASERSSDHWIPFDAKGKFVLDFGCGRWGVEEYSEFSSIWFKNNGATKVVGVDGSSDEINFFKERAAGDDSFVFIEQMVRRKEDVEEILSKYPEVTAIKVDIEGAEHEFCDINPRYLRHVTEIAIEYHNSELKTKSSNRLKEWGFTVHTVGDFYGHNNNNDHAGVLFARKQANQNTSTAIVVCTRGISVFHDDWNQAFKFNNDDYMLCDLTSGELPPLNTTLKYVQDNTIMYSSDNLRTSFNFYLDPSPRHWWNNGGGRNINWFYPHFRMMYFYKVNPNYDYYWFFDDDVTFPNGQLYDFVEKHKGLDHDCMISYIFGDLEQKNQPDTHDMDEKMVAYHSTSHNWLSHYPGDGDIQPSDIKDKYGSYFPLVRLSNRALSILVSEHEKGYYGYSEGYVPTILDYHGLKLYSIYNKQSEIAVDKDLIVFHRRHHQMQWENL
jgi:hypothetical protein